MIHLKYRNLYGGKYDYWYKKNNITVALCWETDIADIYTDSLEEVTCRFCGDKIKNWLRKNERHIKEFRDRDQK